MLKTSTDFLSFFGYESVHVSTVLNWLRSLNYRYDVMKKFYFNDKHNEPSNELYRDDYAVCYLDYERQSYRWIQISKLEAKQLAEDNKILPEQGYHYFDEETQEELVEFHVDDCDSFIEHRRAVEFGGYLSVRHNTTKPPIIVLGQEECIYKQYIFHNKHWVGRDGQRPLLPKDEGQG